jgi:hypothetical protein
MHLSLRKELLAGLGNYMIGNDKEWLSVKKQAAAENHWFVPQFIDLATCNIAHNFLQPRQLEELISKYHIPEDNPHPRKVGIVMAGNIPLVGFHDLICIFLTGHYAMIKPSSKDEVLIKHLIEKIISMNKEAEPYFTTSPMIPNCEAYIATGSNNSSRYFEYYFRKYPSIIRKNRTSVAVLTGKETSEELEKLADDVYQYFGLGCRNVTKIFVPEYYDFLPLLEAFKKYDYISNHHKYKNNYDYNLALHILNNRYYMTNGSIILVEDQSPFSRISQLHYEFYTDAVEIRKHLHDNADIQCIVGIDNIYFGQAQCPQITDYADNVDTMEFLMNL